MTIATDARVADAIADPTRQFDSPMQVVTDTRLDAEQKRQVLESWLKDAKLLSTAQGENMAGGEPPRLQDVSLALCELDKAEGKIN